MKTLKEVLGEAKKAKPKDDDELPPHIDKLWSEHHKEMKRKGLKDKHIYNFGASSGGYPGDKHHEFIYSKTAKGGVESTIHIKSGKVSHHWYDDED